MPDRPRILLTFIPEPDDRPWPVRVRGLLKYAKRAQRLRCTSAEEVAEDQEPKATEEKSNATSSVDRAGGGSLPG
jgi:hypothetical protein